MYIFSFQIALHSVLKVLDVRIHGSRKIEEIFLLPNYLILVLVKASETT
jgi:hypothetical protein